MGSSGEPEHAFRPSTWGSASPTDRTATSIPSACSRRDPRSRPRRRRRPLAPRRPCRRRRRRPPRPAPVAQPPAGVGDTGATCAPPAVPAPATAVAPPVPPRRPRSLRRRLRPEPVRASVPEIAPAGADAGSGSAAGGRAVTRGVRRRDRRRRSPWDGAPLEPAIALPSTSAGRRRAVRRAVRGTEVRPHAVARPSGVPAVAPATGRCGPRQVVARGPCQRRAPAGTRRRSRADQSGRSATSASCTARRSTVRTRRAASGASLRRRRDGARRSASSRSGPGRLPSSVAVSRPRDAASGSRSCSPPLALAGARRGADRDEGRP